MKNTRFMELMFSTTDEELKAQVDSDIKEAQNKGVVDTEEVKYEKTDKGDVKITDKETGEVTLAQKNPDEADTYELSAVPDEQLEKFVHPSEDGVTPGNQVGAPDEKVEDHLTEESKAEPEKAEDVAKEGPVEEEEEEKEFSVTSDNAALQKIFSMNQVFAEHLFSEVIESTETSTVGDLKIEKCVDDDNSVVVTSKATGDQVKVTLDDENMEITELDSKNFSEGDYMPLFVVGVQPYDHFIVDAMEYTQESANDLKAQLEEDGVEAVQIFDNQKDARDYAYSLLQNLGANPNKGDVDEPVYQKEYSEAVGAEVYAHPYRTENTVLMSRMFSEDACGISETRDAVEEAINKGKDIDEGDCSVTPIDAQNAIIRDGEEYTLATLCGNDMLLRSIPAEEANAILGGDSVIEAEADAEEKEHGEGCTCEECSKEKEFSYYTNEGETRFFSENEEMTNYMVRLFSEEAEQNDIESAIAEGEVVETEAEVITPVDKETAIVEDKENGEFTKVTLVDEDTMNAHPISKEEADNMMEDQKEYSIYTNEEETKFFSENEKMTNYMVRLFSEEADQDVIEEAIENGKQIENDNEIVTPVSSTVAIVEDKENGEYTKATLDDDNIEVVPISEEEADNLTKDLKVEDKADDEEEKKEDDKEDKKEDEKEFSSTLDRFFAEVVAPAQAPVAQPAPVAAPAATPAAPAPADAPVEAVAEQPTVEEIEDKALAAVASIKAAAEEASAQIMNAKAAPIETAEPEIQEAQFSEKTFSDTSDTLVSWLQNK